MADEQAEMAATPEAEMDAGNQQPDKPKTLDSVLAELEETRKYLQKANAEAAKYRKAAAAAEDAEKKRKEAEMSEMERLQAQLTESNARLEALRLADLKRKVADAVGLPVTLAARLQGEDEETIKADAQALLESLPKPKAPQIAATNPGTNAQPPRETEAQQRQRVYFGQQANIFDPAWAAQHGGGVIYKEAGTKEQ